MPEGPWWKRIRWWWVPPFGISTYAVWLSDGWAGVAIGLGIAAVLIAITLTMAARRRRQPPPHRP